MTLLWIFLGALLLMLLAFAGLLRTAKRWISEGLELQHGGIETTGLVIAKVQDRTSRFIKYEYSDQFGRRHQRKVMAIPDLWDAIQEQGPISIVYSERRPHISAPKQFLDLMNERRRSSRGG